MSSDSDTSPPLPGVSADRLRNELAVATAAAVDAYRHTSRLIRVLTVLGQPSSPTGLLEQTLTVLSQVYAADVTATVRIVAGRLQLTGACGIPENDPAFADGWPLAGAAAEAVATGRAIARTGPALDPNADVPSSLSDLAAASAVWVPVGEDGTVDELLIMFRTRADGFPPTDLPVLASVASRLRLAVQARRRSASVETLATFGHRLTSRLGLQSLFDEAARLLPLLVDGADGGVLTVRDGVARMRQLTEWQRTAPADRLRISVNHSALQSQQPDAAARTLQTIERAGARPADVWLEITEHSAIRADVTAFATTLPPPGSTSRWTTSESPTPASATSSGCRWRL